MLRPCNKKVYNHLSGDGPLDILKSLAKRNLCQALFAFKDRHANHSVNKYSGWLGDSDREGPGAF